MFTENRDQFFADFGVSATYRLETGLVIFDSPEVIIAGGDVISAEYKITYPTGKFAGLKFGEKITIGGTEYRVNDVQAIEDGALTAATLSKS